MKKIFVVSAFIALAGCKPHSSVSAHDVAWYAAHPSERAQVIAQCQNDPGTLRNTPDCVNARGADTKAVMDPKNTSTPQF